MARLYLHHDDRQSHRETGDASHERTRTNEGKSTWVYPCPRTRGKEDTSWDPAHVTAR